MAARSHDNSLTSGSPQWRGLVALPGTMHRALVVVLDLCHSRWGCGPGQVWCSAQWLCSSQMAPAVSECSIAALPDVTKG